MKRQISGLLVSALAIVGAASAQTRPQRLRALKQRRSR